MSLLCKPTPSRSGIPQRGQAFAWLPNRARLTGELLLRQVRRKPEVMSPAGYWPQLHAAIEAGADAVYFGLKHFTARAKVGFSLAELPEVMRTLHRRGVRGYVTFNTLVFEHELEEAARAIAAIAEAGADAIIVQDYGIAPPGARNRARSRTSRQHADEHHRAPRASDSRRALGADRVTLARELSLDEVRAIREADRLRSGDLRPRRAVRGLFGPVFFFGSLGRPQRQSRPVRAGLPAAVRDDGRWRSRAARRRALSAFARRSVRAASRFRRSSQIGVAALKIEGRYKDADYVALTTRAYRKAVDEAWAGRRVESAPREELQLEQVYSRGLGPVLHHRHQSSGGGARPRAAASRSEHRAVTRVVTIACAWNPHGARIAPLKPGDGLVFDAADWRSPGGARRRRPRLPGATASCDGHMELRFGNGAVDFARIRPGDLVWRTHDPGSRSRRAALHRGRARRCAAAGECARDRARRRAAGRRVDSCRSARRSRAVGSACRWRRPRIAALTARSRCASNSAASATRRMSWRARARDRGLALRARLAAEPVAARSGGASCKRSERSPTCATRSVERAGFISSHAPRRRPLRRRAAEAPSSGPHAGATRRRPRTAPGQHHARLSGPLRPAAFGRARQGRRNRGARGQPARSEAGRGAHRRFSAEPRLPDSGALGRACSTRCAGAPHAPLIGDFSLNAANSI